MAAPTPTSPPPACAALQIQSEADACLRVALAAGENPGYQFKTHPNIDKAAYRWELAWGLGWPGAGLAGPTAGLV